MANFDIKDGEYTSTIYAMVCTELKKRREVEAEIGLTLPIII